MALEEGGVELHAMADERGVADEGAEPREERAHGWGVAQCGGSDAGQSLDTVRQRHAWGDERLEGLDGGVARKLERADLDDGVLLGAQPGGFEIDGDAHGRCAHGELRSSVKV